MAADPVENDCISFVEMEFIDNTLYFIAGSDEELESDDFGQLGFKYSTIENVNHRVLIFNDGQFLFEDMPDSDRKANISRIKFIIYLYKDSNTLGLAVSLAINSEKMHTLSCKDKTISFKEMSPPKEIPENKSDIIFYQRAVPGHNKKIKFESSLYEGCFLACKKEGDRFKLILKDTNEKLPVGSIIFTVEDGNIKMA